MKNKEEILKHLSARWLVYLCYALLAAFVWCLAATLYIQDRPKEVVTVWVLAYDMDRQAFTEMLESEKPEYVKHVRVSFEDRKENNAAVRFRGIGSSMDILILPESFLAEYEVASEFAALDIEYLSDFFEDAEYYYDDQTPRGIKVFDKNSDSTGCILFTDASAENENYYLFVNKASLHMGKLNNSAYGGGIEVIRSILKNESVLQNQTI